MEAAQVETTVTDHPLDALDDILLRRAHCDQGTLERTDAVIAEVSLNDNSREATR
jgi:hypothetical protein